MDRAVFDRMAEIDSAHWWFAGRRAIVSALIDRFLPRASRPRILEIGCGTGSNLAMLMEHGEVDAIEPDDSARALAAARSGIRVSGGFLPDTVTIADGAYDLIVLLDVLEHIDRDRETLALLRTKLAPGGRLLVTVPSSPWMWSAHDVAHHHHRRYTWSRLNEDLEDAGFGIVHHSHFNTLLYPLIAAARIVGRLTGRTEGDDAIPAAGINRLLARVFGGERHAVTRMRLPIGVSLAVVAEVR